jgi:uncharacterized membrane protein YeiH
MSVPAQVFTVPLYFDYGATFLWGITGALIGARRGYDLSGVAALALISSTGGGLLRDGFFLQNGPPVLLKSPIYMLIVAAAALLVFAVGAKLDHYRQYRHFSGLVQVVDALGLGAYAVVGMQLAIDSAISLPGVVLIGLINAVGGGILRDLLMRQEPEAFKPGTLTVVAVLISCFVFIILEKGFGFSPYLAAWPAIFTAFAIRLFSVRYNVRTRPLHGFIPEDRDT